MKIAHVVEAWIGGVANYVTALIAEQQARGHEVILICDPKNISNAPFELDGVEVVYYASSRNPLQVPLIARRLKKLLQQLNADIVHCHSSYPGLYIRLCAGPGQKILYTPHAWSFMKKDITRVTAFGFATIERILARRTSRILCMSFDEVRAARKHGIDMDKIELVYTGIPSDSSVEHDVRDSQSLPAVAQPIQVGYFGRLDYQKGFDIVVDAIPMLDEGVQIHVFGASVRGGINAQNEDSRIVYHGWVDPEGTRRAMRQMDVIVVPSRWEGLALVPIEAMRAGKVLVVSSESSLPEQVIHGYNGVILRQLTGECLARELNALSIDDCRRMGQNSRHVFDEAFRADKFFKSLMTCYENA
ncbi:glycosyltransferase involved in cell wall biosynthesis [Paraburkholderia sp. GAS199]|uniref:glycosyltransferase family 4 protein n=1 Tax=Paraburkholderia sp. GAS199 TaxID=3035126 RepID=UPI003D1B1F7F